jgi:toxin YoeB
MALEVVWTATAERDRKSILQYWIVATGSATYSLKLHEALERNIRIISINPYIGRPTDVDDVRVKLVGVYNVFYRTTRTSLCIVRILDGRHDLRKIKI